MEANKVRACFQGSEAFVYLMSDGVAVRKPKRRDAAAAMKASADLLHVSQHPHLVRIYSIEDGVIYMECMRVSLQKHRPPVKPYAFHIKLAVARAIAQGIHHLHTNNMDHGDLCPANVLLTWQQNKMQVKLSDFYNKNTGIRRTAAYAAPEVVRAPRDIMCAADIWAFACCILFLEGVEPFHGFHEDPAKLFYVALHDCVAFKDGDVIKKFTLQKCAYEPARHLPETAWKDILANAFLSEPLRLSSQQLVDKLANLETQALHPKNTHTHRVPLKSLNF
jgi:serine/threonine protein kinase